MKMPVRKPRPRRPHFFWQGALIFLPVALLAVFSLASLRQDEQAAEQDARNRAAQNVQSLARTLRLMVNDELQRFLTLQSVWMIGLRLAGQPTVSGVFPDEKLKTDIRKWEESYSGFKFTDSIVPQGEVLTDGRQIDPPDIPTVPTTPQWFRQLSPMQVALWETLRVAVDTKASPASIKAASKAFLDSNPSNDARQAALYLTSPPQQIAYQFGNVPMESGITFQDAACYRLLRVKDARLPQTLLFSVFHSRIASGLMNGPLELFLIVDDAVRIFSDRLTAEGEITPFDEALGIVRGAGIGVWLLIQTTVGFSRRARANLAMRAIGRCGTHEDYALLAADCGLNQEQQEYIQHNLRPGTFVGQVGLGSYTLPFLFRVPLGNFPDGVNETEVQQSLAPLHQLPTEFAEEFTNWSPQLTVEVTAAPKEATPVLGESEFRVLRAVVANPGKTISHYCRVTRLNGKRLAEIREQLVAQGYIREYNVASKPRGRTSIVIESLAPAIEAVRADPEGKP